MTPRRGALAVVWAAALGAGAAGCSSSASLPRATATTAAHSSVTTATSAAAGSGPASTALPAPGSGTTSTTNPAVATSGGAIVISSPHSGQTVFSPVIVTGRSRVSSVTVQLSDASGTVLASTIVRPSGGQFSATVRFATTSPGAGTLTAFDTGPGGARQDIATVPVQLGD